MRLDKGTETGQMATIHAYLRNANNDIENAEDTVLYGSSTSNKVSLPKNNGLNNCKITLLDKP